MKYLLDTHIALWLFEGSDRLSQTALDIIRNAENEIYISIISVWEVAIKVSLNKLDIEGGSAAFLSEIEENHIDLVTITGEHIKTVETLPYVNRDPFDRLIIATALAEKMTIITADENIQNYQISWIV